MHVETMKARFRAAKPVMISVHRGDWGPLPENSAAAIRSGSQWDVVEIDLRLDEARRPYLMHDASLARMTGAWAASDGAEIPFLRALRLKESAGGDDEVVSNETIPGLQAAFAALEGSDAIFDLDVKRPVDLEIVAAAVAELGMQGRGTLKMDVLTEWDLTPLRKMEEKYDIMVMPKVKLKTDEDIAMLDLLRAADVAIVEAWFASFDILRRACDLGGNRMRVGVYTLDGVHCCGMSDARALQSPADVWGKLIDCGVGLIMTDQSAALQSYLDA